MNFRTILNDEELYRKAPSIFAGQAHHERSNNYSFINTLQILTALKTEGWEPVQAVQCKVKAKGEGVSRDGFQKHMIRLARIQDIEDQGNKKNLLELVLRNSSDGTSCFQLDAGIFRLVCANGMVIQSESFGTVKEKHKNLSIDNIIDVTYEIVKEAPKLADTMERWQGLELSVPEKIAFANSALIARYGDDEKPVDALSILQPRRWEDSKQDLWHTFNTVQEHLIKGGAKGARGIRARWDYDNNKMIPAVKRKSVRMIKAIDNNVKLNKALWSLAEQMEAFKN